MSRLDKGRSNVPPARRARVGIDRADQGSGVLDVDNEHEAKCRDKIVIDRICSLTEATDLPWKSSRGEHVDEDLLERRSASWVCSTPSGYAPMTSPLCNMLSTWLTVPLLPERRARPSHAGKTYGWGLRTGLDLAGRVQARIKCRTVLSAATFTWRAATAIEIGSSTTGFPSGVGGVPVEVIDRLNPLLQRHRELRIDSAGAGTFRGGLGQLTEMRCLSGNPWEVSAMADRIQFPGPGIVGGMPGACGELLLDGGAIPAKSLISLQPEARVQVNLPGGGGYGDPHKRSAQAVFNDVVNGYVSIVAAEKLYGVRIRYTGREDQLVRLPQHYVMDSTEGRAGVNLPIAHRELSKRPALAISTMSLHVLHILRGDKYKLLLHRREIFVCIRVNKHLPVIPEE